MVSKHKPHYKMNKETGQWDSLEQPSEKSYWSDSISKENSTQASRMESEGDKFKFKKPTNWILNMNVGNFDCNPFENDRDRVICKDEKSEYGSEIEYIGRWSEKANRNESKYRNPHEYPHGINPVTGRNYTRKEAVEYYRDDVLNTGCPAIKKDPKAHTNRFGKTWKPQTVDTIKSELKDKNLLCYCSLRPRPHRHKENLFSLDDACHGDILSSIANDF